MQKYALFGLVHTLGMVLEVWSRELRLDYTVIQFLGINLCSVITIIMITTIMKMDWPPKGVWPRSIFMDTRFSWSLWSTWPTLYKSSYKRAWEIGKLGWHHEIKILVKWQSKEGFFKVIGSHHSSLHWARLVSVAMSADEVWTLTIPCLSMIESYSEQVSHRLTY